MESSPIRKVRIASAALLLFGALATANYYLEWHWLGQGFDKVAFATSLLVLFIFALVIAPGVHAREYKKRQEAGHEYGHGIESPPQHESGRAYPHTISAPHSFFLKRILPFILVAGACALTYWQDHDRGSLESIVLTLLVAVFACTAMVFSLRKDFWQMADIVEDHGDHVVVTRWREKVEIPVNAISQIELEFASSVFVAQMTLREPSALGSIICFYAPNERRQPEASASLAAFIKRIQGRQAD